MGAGSRYGLRTGFLPGTDHHIGNPVTLSGQAAFGVGFTVEASPEVIQGKVHDTGYAQAFLGHDQVDIGGHFHEAANHATVNSRQYWIAKVGVLAGQAKNQIIAEPLTLKANPGGVWNAFEHTAEVTGFLGIAEDFGVGHSSPPVIRSR